MREERKPLRPMRPGGGFGFHMGRPMEKPKNFRGSLKRLMQYLKPRKLQLILVVITASLSTGFSIASPKILGQAITKLFEGMMMQYEGVPGAVIDYSYILRILAILGGLYLLSSIFSYVQQYILAGVSQQTGYQMRQEISDKLSRLPLKFYDTRTHGEIMSRITNDVDNISATLQQSVTQLITAFVTLFGVVAMMLSISPVMTLVCVVTLPLSLVITRPVIVRSQKYFAEQQKALGELNGHVEEMYTGHRVIKAFGRENAAISEFGRRNQRLYEASWRAQFISGIIMPFMHLVGNLGYVLICVVGSIYVTRRVITIGDVQAFIQYARQFSQPITQTASIANILQSTVASAERIFELLDEMEEEPDISDAVEISQPPGDVGFENVNFSYREDTPLITDMNIEVKAGQTVAIVGPTGAGKTTLVNLLMRFYDVDSGQITIDGVDIRSMRRSNLRSLFGMVLQDTWLFNGSIRENIAYGRPDASFGDVVRAATAAQADHFIRTLPDGYDTVLNEEASNISQGQRQLITIARALLADPAILILDEATSNVDTRTEIQIQQAMTELMKGRTNFVIAHRLSTIRNADLILVMNKGRIIEQGTHKALLSRGGFYAELYNSQFTAGGLASQAV